MSLGWTGLQGPSVMCSTFMAIVWSVTLNGGGLHALFMTSWVLLLQTAHEGSYLVRNLLNNLPSVTERVRQMRQGKAPTQCTENELRGVQSQVKFPSTPACAACHGQGLTGLHQLRV